MSHISMLVALTLLLAPMATAQTEWVLEPEAPVLLPAPPGSWDGGGRLIEAVVTVDGIYHMYYRGTAEEDNYFFGHYAIGHATSTDGLSWQLDPANPVMSSGSEDEWDIGSLAGAAVIHDGSIFRMWYAAVSPSEYGLDDVWHGVGYATSADGSSWSKASENPILRPGGQGTFVVPQTVLFDGESFQMWYAASSFWTDGNYPAWSEDGMSWDGFTFAEPAGVPTLGKSVVFDGTRYIMMRWSWGYDPFILGAVSSHGSSWTDFVRHPSFFAAASPVMLHDDGVFTMWYSRYDGIYRATSTCCSTIYTWFIVAAASGTGASGSFYRTEVEINNAGEEIAEYRFAWFPRGQDNSEWNRSQLFLLEPGSSLRYQDVLADVFGLGPGSFGALAVEATTENLLANSRVVTFGESGAGTYGQSIPTLRLGDFRIERDYSYRILFGAEDTDARFNVTCFRGSGGISFQDVSLDLFDAGGELLDTRRLLLLPWGNDQVYRVFDDHRPVNGYVEVSRGGRTYCFGSLLDNQTNDPTTIPPM